MNWDGASASCASAIGSECETAILNNTRPSDDCFSGNFNPGSGFQDACGSVFGDQGFDTQGYRKYFQPDYKTSSLTVLQVLVTTISRTLPTFGR